PAFFSTIRHPPSSPLFPYTTLFRSVLDDEPAAVVLLVARGPHPHLRKLDLAVLRHVQAGDTLDLVTPGLLVLRNLVQRDRDLGGDRKSTRLNSSHVKISYAVFCLKK